MESSFLLRSPGLPGILIAHRSLSVKRRYTDCSLPHPAAGIRTGILQASLLMSFLS